MPCRNREQRNAETAGYLNAFSLIPGFIDKVENIYNLPRINVGGGFKYFLNYYLNRYNGKSTD